MAEVLIPPDIIPDEEEIELVDDGTVPFRPELGRSMEQVQQNYEPRLRVTQRFRNLRQSDRARMIAALRMAEGKFNTVRAQIGRTFRGNMTLAELVTNPTFANGTTGWEINLAGESTLTVADRVMRVTRNANTGGYVVRPSADFAVTQYMPHVARAFTKRGQGVFATGDAQLYFEGMTIGSAPTEHGYVAAGFTPLLTAERLAIADINNGKSAGDYFDIAMMSCSRALQVDNGVNALVRSDELENVGAWGSVTSNGLSAVTANAATSPYGTTTADRLTDDSATSAHFRQQSITIATAAGHHCIGAVIKAGTKSIAWLQMDFGGGASANAFINLTTGVTSNVSVAGTTTNARAYSRDMGDGHWLFYLVAYKGGASTSLAVQVGMANTAGTVTYLGDGTGTVLVSRVGCAPSSCPMRLMATVGTATTGTAQTGSALYVKGGPASTSDAIAMDGIVEVNGEALQLTASLDFDAAGLGYLQFKPSLFRSPADSDPVIAFAPLPRLKLKESTKYDNKFGLYSDFELVMEQHYE